ncbi:MAG: Asp-tRNA(Asn)/Glu-tRNA(Gln) amidotransferase subunit GatB [Coriobacteriales bacterium]|jgi:aspartyl-tRNA(Asn)/glutamyl-tRNA(Gln) amidotransferase subunit B|nr:Asp-tRNA(Asn)/Glu-tRNA(Gln) amidotransferase subunit GatB [Coriobacteriales bacterium]
MKDLQTVLREWEAVIGLEVHTELTTLNTKMFCSCKIEFGALPNTHVCPVCLGLPGALPVPNKAAIQSIVLAGLATNCKIQKRSMFYRKNYFYPDMSKNFQTTQGPIAFCMDGWLSLDVNGNAAKERVDVVANKSADSSCQQGGQQNCQLAAVATQTSLGYSTHIGITRIHMEEDAGKMIHVGGTDGRITGSDYSLVDYNRCGTPLIELVTEPDLRTPEEARLFLQKLRSIYLTLGISDCSMEEGSLRCDGNVSLRKRGSSKLGVKTELKNMNSFKNLHDGLAYEICRQAEVLENGGTVAQETRHWEPANKRTVSMRVKETADDYRLFPEPDLAPYDLSDEFVEKCRARLPELPDAKAKRYFDDYEVAASDAMNLAADVELSAFFDDALLNIKNNEKTEGLATPCQALAQPIANMLLNDVVAYLNSNNLLIGDTQLTAAAICELAELRVRDAISSKQAKEVLMMLAKDGGSANAIVNELGIEQVSDASELETVIDTILAQFPEKVEQYRGGKLGLMGFFVGQAMKETKGQGNPQLLNKILSEKLDASEA